MIFIFNIKKDIYFISKAQTEMFLQNTSRFKSINRFYLKAYKKICKQLKEKYVVIFSFRIFGQYVIIFLSNR